MNNKNIIDNAPKRINALRSCYVTFSDRMGNDLGMKTESDLTREQIEHIDEGMFTVMFIGGFNGGKTTLLNALQGREILRSGAQAETAVITKVTMNGNDRVSVHLRGTPRADDMWLSIPSFFEQYRVDPNHPDKFETVEYGQIHVANKGIHMVQYVDSPGTLNSRHDTKTAERFAKQADAIVFVINAAVPFTEPDKQYISDNFAGKHAANIFFVFNHADELNDEDLSRLKSRARNELRTVFTDKDGHFNEILYSKRVFFTNAYEALMARIGKPITIKHRQFDADISTTGIPEFETALNAYLMDENRDYDAYRRRINLLAHDYKAAVIRIDQTLNQYRDGICKAMNDKQYLDAKMLQLNGIIEQIKLACSTACSSILESVSSSYDECVNKIDSNWDNHFKNLDLKVSLVDMIGVAWYNVFDNTEKLKERMQPFTNAVGEYVNNQMSDLPKILRVKTSKAIHDLKNQLEICQKQIENLNLPIDMDDILTKLLNDLIVTSPDADHVSMPDPNLFQIILGIIGMDPEITASGLAGDKSNISAIVDFIVKNVIEVIAVYIVAWWIGLAMLAWRIIQMITNINNTRTGMANRILIEMHADVVNGIRNQKDHLVSEMKDTLSVLPHAGQKMADFIQNQVNDYSESLNRVINELESGQITFEDEQARMNKIDAELLESISRLNQVVNNAALTRDQVLAMANGK